ncbi:MAG: hypothetical protein NC201_06405 [Prevotella sp.]|nr:hypothetical protein [Bacteroides sp.]MCM1366860.1 hypothetical protein [Prevotella sp.]MCM1437414.1 hypothetical protein [Prevotella sp.]
MKLAKSQTFWSVTVLLVLVLLFGVITLTGGEEIEDEGLERGYYVPRYVDEVLVEVEGLDSNRFERKGVNHVKKGEHRGGDRKKVQRGIKSKPTDREGSPLDKRL